MESDQQLTANEASQRLTADFRAANKGDRSAMSRLRRNLASPQATELVEFCGNLATQTAESILTSTFGDQEASKLCVREKMIRMRNELGWQDSSEMERLLIERVVVTWLSLYRSELAYAQSTENLSVRQHDYLERRIEKAQRKHLAAIKMLATVRKMALPVLVAVKAEVAVKNLPC